MLSFIVVDGDGWTGGGIFLFVETIVIELHSQCLYICQRT